jgi:hypothetical protein
MLAPATCTPRQAVTPVPGGSVLVLGVPFPNLDVAEGACLSALGSLHSITARMRMLSAIVEIRTLAGRAA